MLAPRLLPPGIIQHWLVQVRGCETRGVRQTRCNGARDNTRPSRDLENVSWFEFRHPLRKIARIAFEDQRHQEPIINLRNGARKCPVRTGRHLNYPASANTMVMPEADRPTVHTAQQSARHAMQAPA